MVNSHQALQISSRQYPACPSPLPPSPQGPQHTGLDEEQWSFNWKGNSTAPYTRGQACFPFPRSEQWPHRAVVPQELGESCPQPGTLQREGPPSTVKIQNPMIYAVEKQNSFFISKILVCGRNKETSHRDVCRGILKIPVHLHIYWEVMPLLLADLSTWAFSCNCALKASSWLSKPSRCWTWFYPFLFFFFFSFQEQPKTACNKAFNLLICKGRNIHTGSFFSILYPT